MMILGIDAVRSILVIFTCYCGVDCVRVDTVKSLLSRLICTMSLGMMDAARLR